MPEIARAAGGVVSRLIVTGTDAVPPALVALHVRRVTPSCGLALPQPLASTTGESGSATLQLSVSGPVYQPLAPGVAPSSTAGVTTGGVGSSAIATARSASTKPAPQSGSGTPALSAQSSALAG